jgi:hypothetical protein
MSFSSLQPYIKDGTLVFTLTSNGYKYFTLNLVEHLKKVGVPWKLCIVCADKSSYQFFRMQSISAIQAVNLLPDTGPNISPFGTKDFQRLNRLKLDLLSTFTSFPEVKQGIYLDGDIVVYNDFVPDIITKLATSPLWFQCDERGEECLGLTERCSNACTGFIAWSHGVSPILFQVNASLDLWKKQPEDQVFVNAKLREEGIPFQTLPRDLYPNGQFIRYYSENSLRKATSKILHYNYIVGMDKYKRMRRNNDWLTILL